MTWVKICGITNLEDAKMAVEAGADALGFVFYPKSARNVALERVREITRLLPPEVEKLGSVRRILSGKSARLDGPRRPHRIAVPSCRGRRLDF